MSMFLETLSFSSTSYTKIVIKDKNIVNTFSLRCIMIDFRLMSIPGLDILSSQGIHLRKMIRTYLLIYSTYIASIKIVSEPILAFHECLKLCGDS